MTIPDHIMARARSAQDAAEAECIKERYVYGFGTGNAKTVLDDHIARVILAAVQEERGRCVGIALSFIEYGGDTHHGITMNPMADAQKIAVAIRNRSVTEGE
jgi:hypothetical protein